MIDKDTLDAVLPLPEIEERRDELVAELKEEGFVITNFHSGGIFYTLLMIVLRIEREFKMFLRAFLNNAFVTHASGAWLDLKATDYSKKRKKAQKARGLVTVSRTDAEGDAVKIEKGHVFKTKKDINGEELRFFVLEATVLQQGARAVDVLVEAEMEGSRYNVPEGQITRSLTFLNGIDEITNGADWITREGSDTEDDESARTRTLRSWSELAQRAIEDAFINTAEGVPGVLFAQADCQHPRGQGTVDVIVTGTAGEATEGLLDAVREAVDKIAGPYDNILVKSSVVVPQDIEVAVTTSDVSDAEEIKGKVLAACSADERRPLTDLVYVEDAEIVRYDIDLTYYIHQNASRSGASIAAAVERAVEEYIVWQSAKLGRDINPSRLIAMLMETGIKRVDIIEPAFTSLQDGSDKTVPQLARLAGPPEIINGGYEDE